MYQRCKTHSIPYRQTGKLVVAKKHQIPYIEALHSKWQHLQRPTQSLDGDEDTPALQTSLLTGEEAQEIEPDLSKDIFGALWVPITGIVDSHSFMQSLEKDIIESEGGQVSYFTKVVRVDPYQRSKRPANIPDLESRETGWVIQAVTGDADEGDAILARTVINASGLSSTLILNSLLPQDKRIPMYYAKGSYAKYGGQGVSNVKHLIYPCPETGPNAHAFQSLGTHLTLDLEGRIRFGPDIQWISAPDTLSSDPEEDSDFWTKHMVPDESRLAEMHTAVTSYLPGVMLEGLQPDYCGMRPKLVPPTGGFQDFVFRVDHPISGGLVGDEFSPMISLLGIESPGLTSSLAIAELVVDEMIGQGKSVVG
jgi:L-2-hydroxyglutarate oxidase LhgO